MQSIPRAIDGIDAASRFEGIDVYFTAATERELLGMTCQYCAENAMPTHPKNTELERQSGSEKLHGDPLEELAGTTKQSASKKRSTRDGSEAGESAYKSAEERQDDLETP
jgi:hypothetical protein